MRRLVPFLLLFAGVAAAQPQSPEEKLTVMVANRDIPAGKKLTQDDLFTRVLPRRVISGSMMLLEDAEVLLGTRVLEPLAAGEPVLWTHLSYGQRAQDVDGYCQRIAKARAAQPRAYPKRPAEPVGLVEVLVAALRLPAGSQLATQHLVVAKMPSDFAGPRAVRASEATLVAGQLLTVPLEPGDNLRFSQLAAYASEPRCGWLKEDVGNIYVSKAPAAAARQMCPKGHTRVEGLPGGEEWTPVEPGYAVACLNAQGQADGPYRGWDRVSGKVSVEGGFKGGERDGKWTFHYPDGKKHWEQEYRQGLPVGSWTQRAPNGIVIGVREFADGFRHGKLLTAEVRAEYERGQPTGIWRILRGKLPAEVDMSLPAPPVRGAVGLYARRELKKGERTGPADFDELPIDQMVAETFFVGPRSLSRTLGFPLNVNLPAGAPLAWEDVETGLRASLPVPAIAPRPQRLPTTP